MLNHIVIMGRLTRDPELRRTSAGVAVGSFTVAVDRDFRPEGGERETDFIDCVVWRQTAEFVSKYFAKGSMVVVSGRLQVRNWTDKEGNKRRTAEVVAENVYFGDSKRRNEGNNSGSGNSASSSYDGAPNVPAYGGYGMPPVSAGGAASDFALLDDDDAQLPF